MAHHGGGRLSAEPPKSCLIIEATKLTFDGFCPTTIHRQLLIGKVCFRHDEDLAKNDWLQALRRLVTFNRGAEWFSATACLLKWHRMQCDTIATLFFNHWVQSNECIIAKVGFPDFYLFQECKILSLSMKAETQNSCRKLLIINVWATVVVKRWACSPSTLTILFRILISLQFEVGWKEWQKGRVGTF